MSGCFSLLLFRLFCYRAASIDNDEMLVTLESTITVTHSIYVMKNCIPFLRAPLFIPSKSKQQHIWLCNCFFGLYAYCFCFVTFSCKVSYFFFSTKLNSASYTIYRQFFAQKTQTHGSNYNPTWKIGHVSSSRKRRGHK